MTVDGSRAARRRRLVTGAASVAGHLVVLFILASAQPGAPRPVEPEPMVVELVQPPPPAPPAPPAPPRPSAAPVAQTPPPRTLARITPTHDHAVPLPASKDPPSDMVAALSDAQLAGAATVGSGPGGRPCDMVRRLQAALRKDPRVQAAVADATSTQKALFVWNGAWIRSPGQDGNGLAAVREAIMWEVAFAPEACRTEPVHGLVAMSLRDGPGSERLVVGAVDWRWSDLLGRGQGVAHP
jgi:hypothetical protein